MNPGQKMFYEFFMSHVANGNEEKANKLLGDSFARQDAGTFTIEYLIGLEPRLLALVRPDSMGAIRQAMASFKSRLEQ